MINYEVTLIVDPVLSGDEIKATAQTYVDHLTKEGCTIIHMDEMGLRQLAYPINKRTSGVYFCVEFEAPNGTFISKLELALRRDERIMRFLTVRLDKYGVKYNSDKRAGLGQCMHVLKNTLWNPPEPQSYVRVITTMDWLGTALFDILHIH